MAIRAPDGAKKTTYDIKEENDFTYGTDDDPTMRRREEHHSVSGYCGEMGKGEKEGGPDQEEAHNVVEAIIFTGD